MKNSDAKKLRSCMSYGVSVYIKHDGAPFRALKDGKIGRDVLKMQVMLKDLGYLEGVADGRFGQMTDAALRKFQRDERQNIDGVYGWGTAEVLTKRWEEKIKEPASRRAL